MVTAQQVIKALQGLKIYHVSMETDLQDIVAARLEEAGIGFVKEARLEGCGRIDFLADSIGIEVKKGDPDTRALKQQLVRYAASERVTELVVVCEGRAHVPAAVRGKPCHSVILHKNWGIVLP